MLTPRLQYLLPDNLIPMVSAIVGRNLKQDARFQGYIPQIVKLKASVTEMIALNKNDPDWFIRTHHRRIKSPISSTPAIKTEILEPNFVPKKLISEFEKSRQENDFIDVTSSTRLLTQDDTNFEKEFAEVQKDENKEEALKYKNLLFENVPHKKQMKTDPIKKVSTIKDTKYIFKNQESIQKDNKLLPILKSTPKNKAKVNLTDLHNTNKVATTVFSSNKLLPIQKNSEENPTNIPDDKAYTNGLNDNEIQTDSGIFDTTNFSNTLDINEHYLPHEQLSNSIANDIKYTNAIIEPYVYNKECNVHQILNNFKETNKGFNNSKDNNTDSGLISEVDLQPQHLISAS